MRSAPVELSGVIDDFLAAQVSARTRSSCRTDLAIFLRWLAARELCLLAVKRAHIDRYRNELSELVDGDGEPRGGDRAADGVKRLAVSEITRAQAADLEPEPGGGHSLVITGKGGKRYRVPLSTSTERALIAHLGARRHGFLFRRRDRRRDAHSPLIPYTQQAIWRLTAALATDAGLNVEQFWSLHPHRLRATFVMSISIMAPACKPRRTQAATPPPRRSGAMTACAAPSPSIRPTGSTTSEVPGPSQ